MKNQNETDQAPSDEMSFISHLLELRDRLLRIVLAVIIVFLCLFYFANDLYTYLAGPLLKHMPKGSQMIAIDVASPFLTPFKLALVASIFLSMPYILYQLWKFVAPGLYQHERRMAAPLVLVSSLLFYLGMAFAYFVVFPLVFGFLTGTAPKGVSVMTDITRYLDFVLTIFFAFGIAFQVPIATILLVWSGVTTPEKLVSKRPYVIVAAFVIGMVLTPPDVISQTLLAVPMWVLFELGVMFARFYVPSRDDDNVEDVDEDTSIQGGSAMAAAGSAAVHAGVETEEDTNDSGHGEYEPVQDEDIEDEFDRIDREMQALMPDEPGPNKDDTPQDKDDNDTDSEDKEGEDKEGEDKDKNKD